jgi:cyclopropane fatty-acyl-phospholipid synthase-like methyltransferase
MEGLMQPNINSASLYFNENWQRYQITLRNNTLYHREMLSALQQFLLVNMGSRAFSFVDVGCGDSSTVAPILADTAIRKYIGIDAAKNVLEMATDTLRSLDCEKEFIADNMTTAITEIPTSVDIIYSSYAVHHLSLQDKISFIANCKQKLNPNGFLLMVDAVLKAGQTRNEWLDALQARMVETNPGVPSDEIMSRMQHPRDGDFPESIETFAKIAEQQAWKDFQVLVNKEIFAFMVFAV